MDSICWVETSDDEKLCDAAEEALAEHYDDQVRQFHLDEREESEEKKDEANYLMEYAYKLINRWTDY